MSTASSSKPQPQPQPQPPPPHLHLHLHVDTTSATAGTNDGSAASPGSASSSHHSSRAPRPATPTGGGGGSRGTHQSKIGEACAPCKYQRRKCKQDCPLAPYFPGDQQIRFLRAQRLFGVSNMLKTLKRVGPKYGPEAMRTIIYQSDARAADPVGGCVGIINQLQRQIRDADVELQFVRQQIAICRQHQQAAAGVLSGPAAAMILPHADASSPVVGVGLVAAGQQDHKVAVDAMIYTAGRGQQPSIPAGDDPSSHQQQLYDYFCYNNGTAGDEATSDDGGMQQYGGLADVVGGSVAKAGSRAVALGEQLGQHCQIQIQALPFVDAFNEKKPQILPATIQHHGRAAAGDLLHPGKKKLVTPKVLVEHDDVDEHMDEQQATAGAPCHLELGFSSF